MSVIFVSGFPCSGKTTRSQELASYLSSRGLSVVHISDSSLSISRSVYDDTKTEKPARNAFYSAVLRELSSSLDGGKRVVIADGMNYIKGFRYQLYCAAKEARVRHITVQIAAPPEECKSWNESRSGDKQYTPSTLDNLISRYEEPIASNRWDSPLFILPWIDGTLDTLPIADEIFTALTSGEIKRPNIATIASPVSSTNYLHLLDTTCTSIVRSILSFQTSLGSGQPLPSSSFKISVSIPPSNREVTLSVPAIKVNKPVTLPLLNRHKKTFVEMSKANGKEHEPETIAKLFTEYLATSMS